MPAPCIPDHKISLYLLNVHSLDGGDHAKFFISRGFIVEDPRPLIMAILEHAQPDYFTERVQSAYVVKYIYEGRMPMPDGSNPRIRTVWKLIEDGLMMSLVTAYAI